MNDGGLMQSVHTVLFMTDSIKINIKVKSIRINKYVNNKNTSSQLLM